MPLSLRLISDQPSEHVSDFRNVGTIRTQAVKPIAAGEFAFEFTGTVSTPRDGLAAILADDDDDDAAGDADDDEDAARARRRRARDLDLDALEVTIPMMPRCVRRHVRTIHVEDSEERNRLIGRTSTSNARTMGEKMMAWGVVSAWRTWKAWCIRAYSLILL